MKIAAITVLFAALWAASPAWAQKPGEPGDFDYYVLSLSWSPTYCAGRAGRQDAEQCAAPRRYGFVVHGLWPQYADGGYPVECPTNAAPPDEKLATEMLPLMPSRKLIEHEWKRHGTCFGGGAAQYFAETRRAAAAVKIPKPFIDPKGPIHEHRDRIEAMFLDANPGLKADQAALVCRGRYGAEIRVCLDKNMKFTDCGKSVRDRCSETVLFPPLR